MKKTVHQHSLLAKHGGAARVRQILSSALSSFGWETYNSCEIFDFSEAESSDNSPVCLTNPADMAGTAAGALLFHLHSTADWQRACTGFIQAARPIPLLVTLHDSSLLDATLEQGGECPPATRFSSSSGSNNSGTPADSRLVAPNSAIEGFDFNGERAKHRPVTGSTGKNSDRGLTALIQTGAYFVSPSAWLAGRIKKATGISCKLIPNGVEANPHSCNAARERLGLSVNARMVLFAAHGGVRADLKGAGRWMRIWEQIKKAVPSTVCFMVGGESIRRGNDLFEWPYVDREKMALLMAAADMLVYPSLADNHPLVILEAMSGGTAVSAYSVGGIPEQVRHGENGLLAPLHDEAALVADSIRLLNSPLLLHKMGWAGKELWRRHFQDACMARRYAGLYDELCFGRQGQGNGLV